MSKLNIQMLSRTILSVDNEDQGAVYDLSKIAMIWITNGDTGEEWNLYMSTSVGQEIEIGFFFGPKEEIKRIYKKLVKFYVATNEYLYSLGK